MMTDTPIHYTYLIGWSSLNKWYYGSQYNKKSNPKHLWTKYFTSSKMVREYRGKYGEPDIIQVRQCFYDQKKTLMYEDKVLRRLRAPNKEKWLNNHTGGNFKNIVGSKFTDEHKRKIGEKSKLQVCSPETREKLRNARLGKKLSEEHRRKIGESQRGTKKGPCSEETKRKISKTKKGKPLTITDKLRESWKNRPPQTEYQKEAARKANIRQFKITRLDGTSIIVNGIVKWIKESGFIQSNFYYAWKTGGSMDIYNIKSIEKMEK